MFIDLDKLEDVKFQLTELGRVVSDLSRSNKEQFEVVSSSMKKLKEVLTSTVAKEGLDNLSKIINPTFEQFNKFNSIMDSFIGQFGKVDDYSQSLKKSGEVFSKFSKDLTGIYESKKLPPMITMVHPPKGIDERGKKIVEKKDSADKTSSLFAKEITSVSHTIKGALHKLHIPTPGGILAGLVGIAVLGIERENELNAMFAQAKSLTVNAFDSGVKDLVRTASEHMRDFAYDMEKYAGISKEEVYGIARSFIEAGHGIKETMETVIEPAMGRVGENLVNLTLAVDKMFNLASGTTADRLNDFTRKFGMSLKESKDTVLEMMFFGRESGIGAEYFTSNIEKATDEISSLGLKVGNISEMLYTLQERFKAVGVPRHLAAKEVAKGLGEVAQGLAKISDDWKLFLGEAMGYGKGIEAKQRYEDAISRITSASPEQFSDFINKIVEVVKSRVPNQGELRQVLNNLFEISGGRLALEWNKAVESGDLKRKEELQKEMNQFKEDLKGSFKREEDKLGAFHRSFNKWMEGLSDIGMGLLGKLSKFLAFTVSYFRNSIELITNFLFGGEKGKRRNAQLLAEIDSLVSINDEKNDEWIAKGMQKMKESGITLLDTVFKEGIDLINHAWTDKLKVEPYEGEAGKGKETPKTSFAPTGLFSAPKIVMVPIPIKDSGTYEVQTPEESAPSTAMEALKHVSMAGWAGGGLQIVSKGVDDSGNIVVYLSGNCPKCGLKFGLYEGSSNINVPTINKNTGSNYKGNVSIMRAKTGQIMSVDFADPNSMSRLSEFSRTGKPEESAKTLDPKLAGVLSRISEQYPGKKIKVFRGAAPLDPGEKENPHTKGQAMDIAVQGVSNKELFKFLRSGKLGMPVGKGYYPNLPFVHVDVRGRNAEWVDISASGEKAKYLSSSEKSKYIRENIGETMEESYARTEGSYLKPQPEDQKTFYR